MSKSLLKGAGFRQARITGERWLEDSRERNDLMPRVPILYQAYVCDSAPTGQAKLRSITEFFESPWSRDPSMADTRDALLRLYAIAVKAHFFLFRLDQLSDDPQVFWVPDLMRTKSDRYGLYCPFLKSQKALVVAEADLALVSSGKLGLGRFPVVLTDQSKSWFDEKHWEQLAKEGDLLRLLSDNSADLKVARTHKETTNFPYGYLFDAPEPIRPYLRQAGLRSADALGKMYLPKGFDLEPIQAYYQHLMTQYNSAASQLGSMLGNNSQ